VGWLCVHENMEESFMATVTLPSSLATQLLRQSRIPALRRLSIQESAQEIVLTGSVPSYYLKQLAQECVMPVLGLRQLRNLVLVAP
jgi:hypothetical protein